MYLIRDENNNEKCTIKGHNAYVGIKEYRNTLFKNNVQVHRHKMKGIKSKSHTPGTYESNKISLSCYDDKRYILANGIDTLAYGHIKLNKL